MISLDTNMLGRLLTTDETIQLKAATQLLANFEGRKLSM
jgi:predicted nucleic-acid-binding protein